MSFLYPRRISVRRPNGNAGLPQAPVAVRVLGYSGVTDTDETTVLFNLPASIQFRTPSKTRPNPLPADTHAPGLWDVFIPRRAAKLGQIQDRDIIVNDQGDRFQVEDAYWNSLGYKLRCRLLQVAWK